MIKADIFYSYSQERNKDIVKGFVVEGHAQTARQGEYDLVCAAVSAITQTALLGLNAQLSQKPEWKICETGYLECWLPEGLTENDALKAEVIMDTMELGLKNIAANYEQTLIVSKRRWTKCCSE